MYPAGQANQGIEESPWLETDRPGGAFGDRQESHLRTGARIARDRAAESGSNSSCSGHHAGRVAQRSINEFRIMDKPNSQSEDRERGLSASNDAVTSAVTMGE